MSPVRYFGKKSYPLLDDAPTKMHLEPVPLLKKYLGVTFVHKVAGENKFRAQINRQGTILNLGMFPDTDSAARAYDNASYHLRAWADHAPQYNFDSIPEGSEPMESTIRALAKLRQRFPNFEKELAADSMLTELQRAEKEGLNAVESTMENMKKVRIAVTWAYSRIKMLEVQLKQAEDRVAQRDRVIEGLRITGGHNPFTPVPKPVAVQPNPAADPGLPQIPVDDHLGT